MWLRDRVTKKDIVIVIGWILRAIVPLTFLVIKIFCKLDFSNLSIIHDPKTKIKSARISTKQKLNQHVSAHIDTTVMRSINQLG